MTSLTTRLAAGGAAALAADVAFTTGMIRLEYQTHAFGGLAAAHTSSTPLRS